MNKPHEYSVNFQLANNKISGDVKFDFFHPDCFWRKFDRWVDAAQSIAVTGIIVAHLIFTISITSLGFWGRIWFVATDNGSSKMRQIGALAVTVVLLLFWLLSLFAAFQAIRENCRKKAEREKTYLEFEKAIIEKILASAKPAPTGGKQGEEMTINIIQKEGGDGEKDDGGGHSKTTTPPSNTGTTDLYEKHTTSSSLSGDYRV